jgi:eukaryotic translation initiation factor 2C
LAKNKTVFDGKCNAYAAQEMTVDKLTRKVELSDGGPAPAPAPTSAPTKKAGPGPKKKGGQGGPKGAPAAPAPAAPEPTGQRPVKNKNEFTVKIVKANVIQLEELHRFLRREGPVTPACFTAIQALNIVMSHKLFSEMVSVGRSAFTPNNAQNLGGGIEKWDGIFQSVRPGQGKLYANIDVANTAFIKGGNAAELVAEIKGARSIDDFRSRKLLKRDAQDLTKHFRGCSFTVNHRGGDFKKK